MDLKEEEILGDQVFSHWYYVSKYAALRRDLAGVEATVVLDIGAGSGFFSRLLLRDTGAMRAECVDTGYSADRDEICCGKPIAFRRAIDKSDADLVLAMDVMEHVEDDAALIRSYVDLVGSGTRFVISVPAFNFLWSAHDVFLGHHRRYTLNSLARALTKAGLAVDRGHYYYGAVFPLVAVTRLLEHISPPAAPKSQLRPHSAFVNTALGMLSAAEIPFMRANRLFGLTAFALCHKP